MVPADFCILAGIFQGLQLQLWRFSSALTLCGAPGQCSSSQGVFSRDAALQCLVLLSPPTQQRRQLSGLLASSHATARPRILPPRILPPLL